MISPSLGAAVASEELKKPAPQKKRGVTMPDGTFYPWTYKRKMVQSDIDAVVAYHAKVKGTEPPEKKGFLTNLGEQVMKQVNAPRPNIADQIAAQGNIGQRDAQGNVITEPQPGAFAKKNKADFIAKFGYDPEKEPYRAAKDLGNEQVAKLGEGIGAMIDPLVGGLSPERMRGEGDRQSYMRPDAGEKRTSELAKGLGEAAAMPFDIAADVALLAHPNASALDRAGSIANVILKTGVGLEAGGFTKILAKLKASKATAKVAAELEAAAKGLDTAAIDEALAAKLPKSAKQFADKEPGATFREKPPVKTKATPKVETPKPEAKPATGLANQVQDREALAGIINEVEKTKGKSPEEWQQIGKKAVEGGEDPIALSRRIASGEEELTGKKVGALLEGKRQLQNRLNKAAPGPEFDKALADITEYLDNVQQGKGRWSDVGRALQAGTELDTGNVAQVIERIQKRGGKINEKLKAQVEDMTGKVREKDATIADLEKKLAEERAKQAAKTTASRGPRFSKEDLDIELDDLLKQFREKSSKLSAGIDPELLPVVGKIAVNYMKRGVNTLDDVVRAVQSHFEGATYDDVVQGIEAATKRAKVNKTDLQKQIESLKREAKSSVETRNKIAELQAQLDAENFAPPPTKTEKHIGKQLEDLRAQKEILSRQVQARIQSATTPLATKVLKETTGAIRGAILGTDFGVMTRQGLFAWARPATALKGIGKAAKALIREENLIKIETEIQTRRIGDKLADPIRKKAGLQLTSSILHPEELVVGKLLQRIPVFGKLAGKPLERAQLAFLNTVRSDLFDYGIKHGFSESELKARASFINSSTGRGNIKQVPEWASAIFTSPRYEISRWETLAAPFKNTATIAKDLAAGKGLNRGALANIQDMAVTAGSVYGVFKLAELSGYSVDWNPKSGEFLKMRRGDEVWDITAGLAPRLRDVLRMYVAASDPSYNKNVGDVVRGMAVRTISPAVRMPVTFGSTKIQEAGGKTVGGSGKRGVIDPFSGYPLEDSDEGFKMVMPLIFQSMNQALEKEGVGAALSAGAKEFVGGSINRYPAKKKSS